MDTIAAAQLLLKPIFIEYEASHLHCADAAPLLDATAVRMVCAGISRSAYIHFEIILIALADNSSDSLNYMCVCVCV